MATSTAPQSFPNSFSLCSNWLKILYSVPKLQTALAWVLDELERSQKKENHLNTIYKMMGTLVHVQKLPIGDKIKIGQNLGTLKWPHRH